MPKAAVATAVGSPLEIMDLDLADPKEGEIRIELGASGVCHSDLSVTNGTLPLALPAVLGHEGAGTVVQVGDGVDNLKVGDRIVVSWVPQCGKCYTCLHDQGEICEVGSVAAMSGGLLDMTPRFTNNGSPVFQMAAAGTFSEETVIPAIGAVKLDTDIKIDRRRAHRVRRAHRLRRRGQHREHPQGRHGRGDRLRRRRPQRDPGCEARGCGADHRDRHGRREARPGREVRCDRRSSTRAKATRSPRSWS